MGVSVKRSQDVVARNLFSFSLFSFLFVHVFSSQRIANEKVPTDTAQTGIQWVINPVSRNQVHQGSACHMTQVKSRANQYQFSSESACLQRAESPSEPTVRPLYFCTRSGPSWPRGPRRQPWFGAVDDDWKFQILTGCPPRGSKFVIPLPSLPLCPLRSSFFLLSLLLLLLLPNLLFVSCY